MSAESEAIYSHLEVMNIQQGDSGGPLMCKDDEGLWNVVGISSGDSGCEGPSTAVFTRVTAYKDFISSFLNKGMLKSLLKLLS